MHVMEPPDGRDRARAVRWPWMVYAERLMVAKQMFTTRSGEPGETIQALATAKHK